MKNLKIYLNYLVISFLASLVFTGCGARVVSNVSVFHKLPTLEKEQKVSYSFLKLKGQDNNLEYDSYQEKIKQHLLKNNYVEMDDSNILVSFQYGIDNGKEKVGSMPIFGQTGVSSSYTSGTVNSYSSGYGSSYGSYSGTTTYTPSYGVVGSSSYSYSEYTRYLNVYMYDKSLEKVIYEAKVISSGSSNTITAVIDRMLKALFQNFPGENGVSKDITVY